MNSIELLKKYLHDHLIEKDGNFETGDLVEIRKDAKELGLDERQLSKLLQEVDSSINWEFIYKQKEEAQARESELKKAVEIQKTYEKNAGETLQFIIDQCAKDKVFDSTEIRVFFETSDELNQDENNSARLLKTYFEKNNYIPSTTPKGVSLRITLQSTDWYKDTTPPLPSGPKPPPYPKKLVILVISIILCFGIVLAFFLWLKPYLIGKSIPNQDINITSIKTEKYNDKSIVNSANEYENLIKEGIIHYNKDNLPKALEIFLRAQIVRNDNSLQISNNAKSTYITAIDKGNVLFGNGLLREVVPLAEIHYKIAEAINPTLEVKAKIRKCQSIQ